ncbi:Annexin D5 [Linum perenne]
MSTLNFPPMLPSPRDDAILLHKAFKGFGCDTSAVINILAHRPAAHRAYILHEYRTMFSEDIFKRLASELSGQLENAVLMWMQDPPGCDATIVRNGLMSETSNMDAVTEVICSRTPSQIQSFKQHYHARFHAYLEHDINTHTSGDHKKMLLAYVSTPRYEGWEVDRATAENDAKALYRAGEKKLGTDENTFINIFSSRSAAQLAAVDAAYTNFYGHSLTKKKVLYPYQAVKKETSGQFKKALLTVLLCSQNPAQYFAKALHKAMKGLGTNDTALIRVIVTRAEIDMQYIKAEYLKKYRKKLNDAVHSETSGNYRKFLLALLGPSA